MAYETQDQEEEQSCFSDNTHHDTVLNTAGMAMVWSGSLSPAYPTATWRGPALRDLVAARDPSAAATLDACIAASLAAAKAIPAPLDQALLGANNTPGRMALLATIEALEVQAEATVVAAKAVGVSLDFGANANNAIVGFQEMAALALSLATATDKTTDKTAAKLAMDDLNARWMRVESALIQVNPILYKEIEGALQGLTNAAVRAKILDPAVVTTKAEALTAALTKGVTALKTASE